MKSPLNYIFIILIFVLSTSSKPEDEFYKELYRPQFHFTPGKNLVKEPAAMVFSNGRYHLFYEYGDSTILSDKIEWGHAVSTDLIHWEHLPPAISMDKSGCSINSGSIVLDHNNSFGLQNGSTKTMIAFYSGKGCGVSCSYSKDDGNTWEKLFDMPILSFEGSEDIASPKVFWHEESGKWVMLLSRMPKENGMLKGITFYNSDNLKDWEETSHFPLLSVSPDLFKLNVDKRDNETKWILSGDGGSYYMGSFDGKSFTTESPLLKSDFGGSLVGSKTWVNLPKTNNRIIQMAALSGGEYPGMLFNGQMSFPCELTLKTFSDGVHLLRNPIKELELLHGKLNSWKNKNIIPGIKNNILKNIKGDCKHFICTFDSKTSDNFGLMVRHSKKAVGTEILYDVKRGVLYCLGTNVPLKTNDNKLVLEILVDRSSIEIFANNGDKVISKCFTPDEESIGYEIFTNGGELLIDQMDIYDMNSSWYESKNKMSLPFGKNK